MGADLLEGDVELTEFEAIEVQSIKGVPQGATGIPVLMMKGLAVKADAQAHAPFTGDHEHPHPALDGPDGDGDGVHAHRHTHDGDNDHHHEHAQAADAEKSALDLAVKAVTRGKIDEGPDVDLGKQIMALLGQAISNEADEIAAGSFGETCDVDLLNCAAGLINQWIGRESSPAQQDAWNGVVMAAAADAAKAKLSTAARNDLPDSDFAIPETREYPIHDENHARNALSRVAEHGTDSEKTRVRAAVHKRYPGIGDADGDSAKSAVAEGEASVQTDAQETGSLSKAVEDALAKAIGPLKDDLAVVKEGLAKVMAAPVPGGPVLSAARPQAASGGDDQAAKAAYYRAKAELATDPADRDGYRQLAREADENARKALTS